MTELQTTSDWWDGVPGLEVLTIPAPRAPAVMGSDTSEAAAMSHEPAQLRGMLRTVFWLIWATEGVTDDEGEQELDMRHTTYSARRRDLVLRDLVEDSGKRRPTSSGRMATVWRVKN